jgi:GNAT superfamily N-acetyltransferase
MMIKLPQVLSTNGMTHTTSLAGGRLELVEVHYPDRIMDIGRFRIKGWKNENGIDPAFFSNDYWLDDIDQRAFHWIVTHRDRIVASARLSMHDSLDDVPYAQLLKPRHRLYFENKRLASINRLVVDPEFRREGLSLLLDQVRIDRARDDCRRWKKEDLRS